MNDFSDYNFTTYFSRSDTLNMMKVHIIEDDYEKYKNSCDILFDFKYFNPIFSFNKHVVCLKYFRIPYSKDLDELLLILLTKYVITPNNIYSAPFEWLKKLNGKYIGYLEHCIEQDDKLCEWIIFNKDYHFGIITNPSIEMCKKAIDNHISMRIINNKCEEICKYAVDKNPHNLKYIEHNYELCKYAFDKDNTIIQYISNSNIKKQLIKNFDKEDLFDLILKITCQPTC